MAPARSRWDAVVPLLLALATAGIYFPIVVEGRVFASFDTLVYFYPNASYLAQRLRTGQIPLWDPYLFAGVPFLANSQVGALYPPNWLYAIGPISTVYSLLFVGHVWLLGLGVYLVGRQSLSLGPAGSGYAALAVALSGFVGGMSGHLNQVEALAWTPFAVLGAERAVARRSWRLAALSAAPIAFCAFAGHSQVLYMTAVLVLAASIGRAFRLVLRQSPRQERPRLKAKSDVRTVAAMRPAWFGDKAAFTSIAGLMALGPALAVLLSASQLLPTLELTRQSIRATGLSFADAAAFSFPPTDALIGLLPTVNQPPPSTEWMGYVGLSPLLFAAYAIVRRRSPVTVALASLALVGLVLAVGQVTPIYRLLFEVVPGFRLFRVPARWLTFWVLGVGLLAGCGLEMAICDQAERKVGGSARSTFLGAWQQARCALHGLVNQQWPLVASGTVVAIFLAALTYHYRQLIARPSLATVILWMVVVVTTSLALAVQIRRPGLGTALIFGTLVGELFVSALGQPQQQAVWPSAFETQRATVDHLLAAGSADRVMALGDNSYDPGDLADLRRMLGASLPADARDTYITAVKHNEGLTPNLPLRYGLRTIDGYDGGILPLARYTLLKQLFPVQGNVVEDGRLRIQLKTAPDPRLLGWLNVHYLMMDRLRDQWIDGVYYDLGISQTLSPDSSIDLPVSQPFPLTSLGIALRADRAALATGFLEISAGDQRVELVPAQPAQVGKAISTDTDPDGLLWWKLPVGAPTVADTVRLTWHGPSPIVLRALTLIDDRTRESLMVTASPLYQLSMLGDMKIYEDRAVLPRAFLADGLTVAPDLAAAQKSLSWSGWDPTGVAVASATDVDPSLAFAATGPPGDVRIVRDDPETVVADTNAADRRVLVLTDSAYPGWQASVDGRPAPILTVNLLFRGVVIPAGHHEIAFSYAPWTWLVGVIGTWIGVAIIAIVIWANRRPRTFDEG